MGHDEKAGSSKDPEHDATRTHQVEEGHRTQADETVLLSERHLPPKQGHLTIRVLDKDSVTYSENDGKCEQQERRCYPKKSGYY